MNYAGINRGWQALVDLTMGQVEVVVPVNLLGVLFCMKVALDVMGVHAGMTGPIFNTVGSGVKGGGRHATQCRGPRSVGCRS